MITSKFNNTKVSKFKVCLIFAMLRRMEVNMKNLMLGEMQKVRLVGKDRIIYPSMLTSILRAVEVPRNLVVNFKFDPPNMRFDVTASTSGRTDAATRLTMEQILGRIEPSIQILFADLEIRIDNGEASLKEVEMIVLLGPATRTFLGLQ